MLATKPKTTVTAVGSDRQIFFKKALSSAKHLFVLLTITMLQDIHGTCTPTHANRRLVKQDTYIYRLNIYMYLTCVFPADES